MKVALGVAGSDPPRSGLGVYATELVRGLRELERGPRMIVYGPRRQGAASSGAPVDSVTTIPIWSQRLLQRGLMRLEWCIPNFDLVHFPDVQTAPTRKPSLVTVHDLAPFRLREMFPDVYTDSYLPALAVYRRTLPRAVEQSDLILCDSESTRADLLERFPRVEQRSLTVRLGARSPAPGFQRRPRPAPPLILMVGRVEFRKNIVVAAQAMKLLADRGVDLELHVAGSLGSPEAPGIRRQCEAAWSARSIRWHGEVDELTLHRLHEEATMLLFPSLYEGFGIPPLEALVAGIPVVASDIEVHRETMGGITRLVSPTSVEAWADAIGAVLDGSADMPHDVAARLRERSIAWDLCASATAASYQRVLS